MDEIKKCPFCGGEATYRNNGKYDEVYDDGGAFIDIEIVDPCVFIVECSCGAQIVFDEREELVIAAWNRRAQPCEIKEYMESCEDCGFCAQPENTGGLLNTLRSRLHRLSYESSDWSHGEHPRVVELDEIDDLFDEFDEMTAKPENKPLTLDELRGRLQKPVFIVYPKWPYKNRWDIVEQIGNSEYGEVVDFTGGEWENTDELGEDWFAYDREPQEKGE